MTCNGCQEQYVGMTNDALFSRNRVHKQQINHPEYRKLGVSKHIDECSELEIKYSITPFYQLSQSRSALLTKEDYFVLAFKPSLNSVKLT